MAKGCLLRYCQSHPFLPYLDKFSIGPLSPLDFTGWANQEITPFCTHISGIWVFLKKKKQWDLSVPQKKNSGIWEGHKND
jgi:hypothetical protein